ncbi:MAG: hypothetical protein JWR38_4938 [Mucilaginibacter sp.]|nr:hypothetical protein [Mucilaginibacter sp.]
MVILHHLLVKFTYTQPIILNLSSPHRLREKYKIYCKDIRLRPTKL